jgi:prepilin-type processing-associated H-X9-DG protein
LRNAGLATTMYLDENDGMFWPYSISISGTEPGQLWWFGFEPGGPAANPWQGSRPLIKSAGFLGRYLAGSGDDLICPSFPYGQGRYFPKFSPPAGGFGYNSAALGGYNRLDPANPRGRRIKEFEGRTSEVFVLADGIHFDRLDYSSSPPLKQRFNEPPYIQWSEPSLFSTNFGVQGGYGHFRHNGRAEVLFLDGHVAAQPVRRPLHPFSGEGFGRIANLSDESLRVLEIVKGNRVLEVDLIYGLE